MVSFLTCLRRYEYSTLVLAYGSSVDWKFIDLQDLTILPSTGQVDFTMPRKLKLPVSAMSTTLFLPS